MELADGATVFFDEANDIPPAVQVKLLRVLEQHEVTPVGAADSRRTAFRVIAATSRDLADERGESPLRHDLCFGWQLSRSSCPRYATGSTTFRCWRGTFCDAQRRARWPSVLHPRQ